MTPVTEKYLRALGYRKYTANEIVFPFADFFMQKRFDDEKGKKYYIDFVHYPKLRPDDPNNRPYNGESWMVEMRQNEPYQLQFRYHRPESIEIAEYKVDKFWVKICDGVHYDLFEEK